MNIFPAQNQASSTLEARHGNCPYNLCKPSAKTCLGLMLICTNTREIAFSDEIFTVEYLFTTQLFTNH